MTIKRISKRKKTKIEKESLTDSFINSGGKTTKESDENHEKLDFRFTLRVPSAIIHQIDEHRKKKIGSFSRNNWILEAIEEKLDVK